MKKQIVENHKAIEMLSLSSIITLGLAAGTFAYLDFNSLILAAFITFAAALIAVFCGTWPLAAVGVKELNKSIFGTMNIASSTILIGMIIFGIFAVVVGILGGILENKIEGMMVVIAGLSFIFSSTRRLSTTETEPVVIVNGEAAPRRD